MGSDSNNDLNWFARGRTPEQAYRTIREETQLSRMALVNNALSNLREKGAESDSQAIRPAMGALITGSEVVAEQPAQQAEAQINVSENVTQLDSARQAVKDSYPEERYEAAA